MWPSWHVPATARMIFFLACGSYYLCFLIYQIFRKTCFLTDNVDGKLPQGSTAHPALLIFIRLLFTQILCAKPKPKVKKIFHLSEAGQKTNWVKVRCLVSTLKPSWPLIPCGPQQPVEYVWWRWTEQKEIILSRQNQKQQYHQEQQAEPNHTLQEEQQGF